jgi:hypothetical protein
MEQFDIWLDDNQEIQVENNDLKLGIIDNNVIKYIILAAPGHYKLYPTVGANIWQFVNGNYTPAKIERAIRSQLEADIIKNPDINIRDFPTMYINKLKITTQ